MFWLLGGVGVFLVLTIGALSLSTGWLAKFIPFDYEKKLASYVVSTATSGSDIQGQMQELADRLAAAQSLPEGMEITIHYDDSEIVNAFATLVGDIFIFRGLIEALPSEDALAMVIAHEIAHIKHRHPIRALGRDVTVGIALSAIMGVSESTAGERVLGDIGLLTSLSFSRTQEYTADNAALTSLVSIYGHGTGAIELFEVFETLEQERLTVPEILSTRPHLTERLDKIHESATQYGWLNNGKSRPMPGILLMPG